MIQRYTKTGYEASITKVEIANVRANLERQKGRQDELIIRSPADGIFVYYLTQRICQSQLY